MTRPPENLPIPGKQQHESKVDLRAIFLLFKLSREARTSDADRDAEVEHRAAQRNFFRTFRGWDESGPQEDQE